jgi:hypothetical protein
MVGGRLLTRLRPSLPSGVVVMLSMKMLWLRLLCLFSWCSPITRLDSPCKWQRTQGLTPRSSCCDAKQHPAANLDCSTRMPCQ